MSRPKCRAVNRLDLCDRFIRRVKRDWSVLPSTFREIRIEQSLFLAVGAAIIMSANSGRLGVKHYTWSALSKRHLQRATVGFVST